MITLVNETVTIRPRDHPRRWPSLTGEGLLPGEHWVERGASEYERGRECCGGG